MLLPGTSVGPALWFISIYMKLYEAWLQTSTEEPASAGNSLWPTVCCFLPQRSWIWVSVCTDLVSHNLKANVSEIRVCFRMSGP